MRIIQAQKLLTDEQTAALAGKKLRLTDIDTVISGEDCDVIAPDGTYLVRFRAGILDPAKCVAAYKALLPAAVPTDNRGMAAGELDPATGTKRVAKVVKAGYKAKRTRSVPVLSGIVGYFDRSQSFPYCRQTAFTIQNQSAYQAALPLVQQISEAFHKIHPDRWAAQKAACDATDPAYVMPGTVFTTITVNKNWQTAVHQDAGDLAAGYGVMTALRAGEYTGGYTAFPQYRLAVDMRNTDLLLANVHEWHGNLPLVPLGKTFVRLSLVMYYRARMMDCLAPGQELKRAQSGTRKLT